MASNRGVNQDDFSNSKPIRFYRCVLEDTGEPFKLDVIAICCEFTEYADLAEVQESYPDIESMDDLRDNTIVIEFDSGIIIQDY